jgi:uncharacterized membrane protein
MNSIHKQRILIISLAAIGAISVFLPWVKGVNGNSISGIAGKGFQSWGALLALIATIVVCTFGEKEEPLEGLMKYLAIGLSGVAALLGIYKVLDTIGFGLILLQVSSIGALMAALNSSLTAKKSSAKIIEIEDRTKS